MIPALKNGFGCIRGTSYRYRARVQLHQHQSHLSSLCNKVYATFRRLYSHENPNKQPHLLNIKDKLVSYVQPKTELNKLQQALTEENPANFKALLPQFEHVLQGSPQNPLHFLAMQGRADLIPVLLERFEINKPDSQGLTALHWAIHEGHLDAVRVLIEQGASLAATWKAPDGTAVSCLEMAVAIGDSQIFQALLQGDTLKQMNLKQRNPRVGTLLHLAILSNQSPMLEYLLHNHYADVKDLLIEKDPDRRTPLQLAAYLGDLYAIKLLADKLILEKQGLDAGEGEPGGTAVHQAALGKQPEAIRCLDFLGAKLNLPDDQHKSPIHYVENDTSSEGKQCKALLANLSSLNRKEKASPPNYKRRPPFNLVFEGGGPRGVAHVGALRKMEENGLTSQLKRIAGTSAGAITAALFAVGCSSEEIKETLFKLDFTKLLDTQGELHASLLGLAQKPSVKDALRVAVKEYWQGIQTLLHPIQAGETLMQKLNSIAGLCSGEELRLLIEGLIAEKTGVPFTTFKELRQFSYQRPEKYKELHIFSTQVEKGQRPKLIRFSHEDERWQNLIISDATRASASIPGVYQPHILHFKDASNRRHPRPDYGVFLDGGMIRNYPLDAFDSHQYQEEPYLHGDKTNRRTLGFSLQDTKSLTAQHLKQLEGEMDARDIVQAVVATYFYAEKILREHKGDDGRTIRIPIPDALIGDVGLANFSLTDQQKEGLIAEAEKAYNDFFFGASW